MSRAIEARDVFRVYSTPEGDAAALQGLSLAVEEGEHVAILGPSGAGKTTLLRILAGLDRPSAGVVRVFETNVAHLRGRRLAAYRSRTLGYLDQHYSDALAPELTARDLVAVRPLLLGAVRRAALTSADALLERIGLLERRDSRPGELSGGEQQRVAVAAALAHHPRLLLCDEPTGELDSANARVVYELISELARADGCTVVLVSHDPASTELAHRSVRIRDGRVSEEALRDGGGKGMIVVGRGGWLRLPEELLQRAGIAQHASARFEGGHIRVEPVGGAETDGAGSSPEPHSVATVHEIPAPGGEVASTEGVTKTHGRGRAATTALAPVTASFDGGRVYAVTGPSGSGKTTLLHILAGLELPTSGRVSILGTSIAELPRAERARFRAKHVAVVSQEVGLIPFLSARQNVELGLALRRGARPGDADAALEALAAVGLSERAEQRAGRLSTGERVRLGVARALAARPSLLLADEPTARLDQANALAVATLLANLTRDAGIAVLCATHDPLVIDQAGEELALGTPA
jgi:putative ABC transport system ATP-binding protein